MVKELLLYWRDAGVVDYFREEKDYAGVREIQKDIVRQYKGDFGKHVESKELPRIIWFGNPFQCNLQRKIRILFWTNKKRCKSSEFEVAIQWLLDCVWFTKYIG